VINFFILLRYFNWSEAIGYSLFHTISAFNNAGFDIFGSNSMISFNNDVLLDISTMVLVVLGGLGFIVIVDIFSQKKANRGLSFHTKVVLSTTLTLIIGGFILIKLALYDQITWLEALFTSITARTAGFTVINLKEVLEPLGENLNPIFILIIFLMFVGASPCSTGGGVKTTSLFTIVVSIYYLARGKKPKAFKRNISNDSILKAFSLVILALLYIMIITFAISAIEKEMSFTDITFEVVSAFGTVGLSMGITSSLSTISKILIAMTMFFGRLGPLTIASLWNSNWMKQTNEGVRYIEEKIIIG